MLPQFLPLSPRSSNSASTTSFFGDWAPPAPGLPGPFSAAALGDLLEDAGFADIEVRRVDAPLRLPRAADCMRLERDSFGALHQMLARLTPAEQDEVWDEIGRALREFEGADGFCGPCELIVGGGTA